MMDVKIKMSGIMNGCLLLLSSPSQGCCVSVVCVCVRLRQCKSDTISDTADWMLVKHTKCVRRNNWMCVRDWGRPGLVLNNLSFVPQ